MLNASATITDKWIPSTIQPENASVWYNEKKKIWHLKKNQDKMYVICSLSKFKV